jgi:hypothetical protein
MDSNIIGARGEDLGISERQAAGPQADAGAGCVGLSLASNLTADVKDYRLVGFLGASYLSVTAVRVGKGARAGGGERKPCLGFSKVSRLAMVKTVSKLKASSVCLGLFITLTYPGEFPDGRRAKRDLDVFLKRLARAYPGAAGIWKLEPQGRGAPHFHLLVLGVSFIPYQWLGQAWYEVCVTGDPNHLLAGTEVRRVKSYQHAVHYVSKYIGKETLEAGGEGGDGLGEVGRRWGHFGDWRVHLGEFVTLTLTREQTAKLTRVLDLKRLSKARLQQNQQKRAWAVKKARRRRALSLSQFWLGSPDFVLSKLMQIIGSGEVGDGS